MKQITERSHLMVNHLNIFLQIFEKCINRKTIFVRNKYFFLNNNDEKNKETRKKHSI